MWGWGRKETCGQVVTSCLDGWDADHKEVHKAERRGQAHCQGGWERLPGGRKLSAGSGGESDGGHGGKVVKEAEGKVCAKVLRHHMAATETVWVSK